MLISYIGGVLTLVLVSLSTYLLYDFLHIQVSLADIIKISLCLVVPGSGLGVEKEGIPGVLPNLLVFSISFMYPLYFTLDLGPAEFLKQWIIGCAFGLATGIFGAFLLRLTKFSSVWGVVEVTGTSLICIFAYTVAAEISGSSVVALLSCGLVVSKYVFVTDTSGIIRSNVLQSFSGIAEVLAQIWLGLSLYQISIPVQALVVVFLVVCCHCVSNLICVGIGCACKLRAFKLKDCLKFSTCGFRGIASLFLIETLPVTPGSIAVASCFTLNLLSIPMNKLFADGKDEINYLVSSNPCTKLKTLLQVFEDNYILPVFSKEKVEESISSPKFNENSQRFDAGIQLRQEPRDETHRELQALNLNLTETEMNSALQLK